MSARSALSWNASWLAVLAAACFAQACGGGGDPGSGASRLRNRASPAFYTQSASAIPHDINDAFYASKGAWSPTYKDLWGHIALGVAGLYGKLQLPQNDVVVAVVDTGVDMDHEDLAGRLWVNPQESAPDRYSNHVDDDANGFPDDFIGWDWVDDSNNPSDNNGHGTHVAGTIAAVGGNARGIIGVAPWVRIMALKVCDFDGYCDSRDIRDAIHYAAHSGAKVINLSLGGPDDGAEGAAFDAAIEDAWRNGALVVAASGNEASDAADFSPANARFAMAVAALRSDGRYCGFSNAGWKIDLAAPGCGERNGGDAAGMLSLNSRKCGGRGDQFCAVASAVEQDYALKYGTSMAAPHVSGLAAVAWTISPEATPLQIRQAVLKAASPIANGAKNVDFGFGKAASKNLMDWAKEAPGLRITSPFYGAIKDSHDVRLRIESRGVPVDWALRVIDVTNFPGAELNLAAGAPIGSGTVGANTAVDISEPFTPPSIGNFLLVLQANASGEAYYDTSLIRR